MRLKRRKDDDVEWVAGEDWESDSDDAYIECLDKLGKLMLFPADGNMTFKVEEIVGDDSRAIIVDGVMYDSLEDYRKVQSIKRKEQR